MFNVFDTTTVYVLCPPHIKTGGTELLHQLVYFLQNHGVDAFITYSQIVDNPIPVEFEKYVGASYKNMDEIDDKEDNILILPEVSFKFVEKYKSIQKAIWWLSVDNFARSHGFLNAIKYRGIIRGIASIIKGRISVFEPKMPENVVHLYQSQYALNFLLSRGVKKDKLAPLFDYINDEYLGVDYRKFTNRENIVLYNPKKGYKFTKKLQNSGDNFKWIAIEGLSNNEVKNLLLKSKVYIDFGNHPGKDRFPREAAMCGCCIITGRNGAASNNIDVPIPEKYKFIRRMQNKKRILDTIMNCIAHYEEYVKDFDKYRSIIKSEKKTFKQQVEKLFSKE